MKKRYAMLILFAVMAIAALLPGCSLTKNQGIKLTGSIEGSITNVSSEAMAKVVDLKKTESDPVKAGELVYVLDSKVLELQKAQIEAQLKALQTQIKMARDNSSKNTLTAIRYSIKAAEKSLEVIDKELEALEEEANVNEDATSAAPAATAATNPVSTVITAMNNQTKETNQVKLKLQREQTVNQIDSLKLQLKNATIQGSNTVQLAKDNLAAANKSLELVKENIKKCYVYSPVSGTITTLNYTQGELVPVGSQLFTVMDTKKVYLKIFVPERYLDKVTLGNALDVVNPAEPDKAYKGKVVKIDEQGQFTPRNTETADEKSNVVFGVKLQLDTAANASAESPLKPGMIAEVTFDE